MFDCLTGVKKLAIGSWQLATPESYSWSRILREQNLKNCRGELNDIDLCLLWLSFVSSIREF